MARKKPAKNEKAFSGIRVRNMTDQIEHWIETTEASIYRLEHANYPNSDRMNTLKRRLSGLRTGYQAIFMLSERTGY